MQLFNTLTKQKEAFAPLRDNHVRMYCCGPTVYNFAHIGNLRTYIFEDILRRTLEMNGFTVDHVMNITDVGHLSGDDDDDTGEDKMLKGARREKKTVWDIAEFYTNAFLKDMELLNIVPATHMPRATDHIKEMIVLIQALEAKGFTYEAGGNIYFDTEKFERYRDFAQLPPVEQTQGRVALDENKKSQRDFALWFTKSKFDDQEMKWESPWGVGYPGWHIECSAMSLKYLGQHEDITQSQTFDIHCGGVDHVTVHHTNEVAQTECVTDQAMARFWLHGEFLMTKDNEKMAKSGDNFLTLQRLVDEGFEPLAYRYFCLGAHYRSKLAFSFEALQAAQNAYNKLKDVMKRLGSVNIGDVDEAYQERFIKSLDDDLATPAALALVWELVKDSEITDESKKATLFFFDKILGLQLDQIHDEKVDIPVEIMNLVEQRQVARDQKDWSLADTLRNQIKDYGYHVEDSADGQTIKKI